MKTQQLERSLDEPSVCHNLSTQIRFIHCYLIQSATVFPLVRWVTVAARHRPAVSCPALRCLTKLSPRPLRSREKPFQCRFMLCFSTDKTSTLRQTFLQACSAFCLCHNSTPAVAPASLCSNHADWSVHIMSSSKRFRLELFKMDPLEFLPLKSQ